MFNRLAAGAAFFLFILSGPAALAEEQQASKAAREIVKVAGMAELMTDGIKQQEDMFKQMIMQQSPGMKAEDANRVWQLFVEEFEKFVPDALNKIGLIYDKHFTDADLTAIAEFYRTPAGQKLVSQQAAIMGEATRMGQIYGAQAGQAAMKRFVAEKQQQ